VSRRIDGQKSATEILGLVPGCDSSALKLSAEEGFLLSRIDGLTPWSLLVEMAGVGSELACRCRDEWLAAGVVQPVRPAQARGVASRHRPNSTFARDVASATDASRLDRDVDPDLEIDLDTQRKILEFEARSGGDYYALLGIEPGADDRTIKKAYFKLSREFHPDRFFRRDLGPYTERLALIYRMVLEAYAALSGDSDSACRDSSRRVEGASSNVSVDAWGAAGESAANRPEFEKLKRLGERAMHTMPKSIREERRRKAQGFFEAAQNAESRGKIAEARANLQMAIRFEPANPTYRGAMKSLENRVSHFDSDDAVDAWEFYASMSQAELACAWESLKKALRRRPKDSSLNQRAACVALARNEFERAKTLAGIAVEESPEVGEFHTTLGKIHWARGRARDAKREFERALACELPDREARRGLAELIRTSHLGQGDAGRG
jgi:curved DNA-binding protein CbpA